MAEELIPPPGGGSRQIITIATVLTVVFFTVLLLGLRSCSSSNSTGDKKQVQQKLSSDVTIYSNLDLKDSALVVTRLKELKIPYQIQDEGRAIAVPRGRADEARLGLAEKDLPAGGTVGWEIFDQSKLGATDFDRRIQFIRAISGELSRNIDRISAVEDARVQIVIPETKLFEATTSPVTASILLKMKPGEKLEPGQVNGIIHLVAGSVENLRTENITIIDTDGNIMTGKESPTPKVREETLPYSDENNQENQQVVVQKTENKEAQDVQAKLELEDKMTGKVQSLLNRMFPPNTVVTKATVDSLKDRKITVIILVDNKYKMSGDLKKSVYDTVSAAVGYDRSRGDKIILKSVVFRSTGSVAATRISGLNIENPRIRSVLRGIYRTFGRYTAIVAGVVLLLFFFVIFRMMFGRKKERPEETVMEPAEQPATPEETESAGEIPIIEQMKTLAVRNPEQAAQLIRNWVTEENL